MDGRELLDKLDKLLKKIENLEEKVIEISKENEINNGKIEELINNKKSRRKKK